MGTLTGQFVSQSYGGLLHLSTNVGIASDTFTSIEDGVGTSLGVFIKTGGQISGSGFTGSFNGTATSASYALNSDLLDGKDSTTFATTGSNQFNGNQNISGSIRVTNSVGNLNEFSSGSFYLEPTIISGSAINGIPLDPFIIEHINLISSGGNLYQGYSTTSATASFVISGSHNRISLSAAGTNVVTTANTRWGFEGNNNDIRTMVRSTGSGASGSIAVVPIINNSLINNTVLFNNLNPNRTTNGGFQINNVNIQGQLNANISSGSCTFDTNALFGGITNIFSNASGSFISTIAGNVFGGGASRNINLQGERKSFNNNIVAGTSGNFIITGLPLNVLQNSLFVGNNLIATGSMNTNSGSGMAILGRLNAQTSSAGLSLNTDEQTVLAVGTGTSTSARRTSFHISSSGLTQIFDGLELSGGISGSIQFNGNQTITGSIVNRPIAITPSSNTASLNLNLGNTFTLTLIDSVTLHISASNLKAGQSCNLQITQPAGVGSVTFNSVFTFPSGSSYVAFQSASAVDVLSFTSFDGTKLRTVASNNFI
jgi:hypothetical protein